jgi:hypothetical protein
MTVTWAVNVVAKQRADNSVRMGWDSGVERRNAGKKADESTPIRRRR